MIEQGQIYWFDFGVPRSSKQAGLRPALVIQTDLLNEVPGYELVLVSPISTKGRPSPSHVRLEPTGENGLRETSFVKCEQIYTVEVSELQRLAGTLSRQELYAVKEALRVVLSL